MKPRRTIAAATRVTRAHLSASRQSSSSALAKKFSATRRLARNDKLTLSLLIFIAGLVWMVSETPKNSTKFLDDIVLALALILIVLSAGMAYTVISAERTKAKDRKQATEASHAAGSETFNHIRRRGMFHKRFSLKTLFGRRQLVINLEWNNPLTEEIDGYELQYADGLTSKWQARITVFTKAITSTTLTRTSFPAPPTTIAS